MHEKIPNDYYHCDIRTICDLACHIFSFFIYFSDSRRSRSWRIRQKTLFDIRLKDPSLWLTSMKEVDLMDLLDFCSNEKIVEIWRGSLISCIGQKVASWIRYLNLFGDYGKICREIAFNSVLNEFCLALSNQ